MQSINNKMYREPRVGGGRCKGWLVSGHRGQSQTALANYGLFSSLILVTWLGVICANPGKVASARALVDKGTISVPKKANASAIFSLDATTSNAGLPNEWYVAPNGNNSQGNGSKNKPWKTIAYAISRMSAGDMLVVKDGVYVGKENFIFGVPAGTKGRPTLGVFGACGLGRQMLQPTDAPPLVACHADKDVFQGVLVEIRDLVFVGATADLDRGHPGGLDVIAQKAFGPGALADVQGIVLTARGVEPVVLLGRRDAAAVAGRFGQAELEPPHALALAFGGRPMSHEAAGGGQLHFHLNAGGRLSVERDHTQR